MEGFEQAETSRPEPAAQMFSTVRQAHPLRSARVIARLEGTRRRRSAGAHRVGSCGRGARRRSARTRDRTGQRGLGRRSERPVARCTPPVRRGRRSRPPRAARNKRTLASSDVPGAVRAVGEEVEHRAVVAHLEPFEVLDPQNVADDPLDTVCGPAQARPRDLDRLPGDVDDGNPREVQLQQMIDEPRRAGPDIDDAPCPS